MRINYLVLATVCCLTACTVEAPPEESEPVVAASQPEEEPEGRSFFPQIKVDPAISDAIIPGDPSWPVESWTRLREGRAAPRIDGFPGQVLVILCFQHW
jgi:hypothetical protein